MTAIQLLEMEQGTPEWFQLRKTKITATDACVIMGVSKWKTILELYHEKLSNDPPKPPTKRQQRGIDLEPVAREFFTIKTSHNVHPQVVVKDWAMASLDGFNRYNFTVVEIKCPGVEDHSVALSGNVPDHYYPQCQFQMWVCDVPMMYYFSFDGIDGTLLEVRRNDEYIENMVKACWKFYQCLHKRIPPEPPEDAYKERNDDLWTQYALHYKSLCTEIKKMEKQEEELRKELIHLSGESNTKGAGITLCKVQRKGNVNYSKIESLKGIDLESYRGPTITSWRISI